MNKNSKVLWRTRVYLIGHMEFADGRDWRRIVRERLDPRNIICFDPYDKLFVPQYHTEEDEAAREELKAKLESGDYDWVQNRMWAVRGTDLSLVDRSDFIICHIVDPKVGTWGTAEELVTAVRAKRPVFISVEGGKKKCPLWVFGMLPHKYIYDSLDESLDMICAIDDGTKEVDSTRWKLLKREYR